MNLISNTKTALVAMVLSLAIVGQNAMAQTGGTDFSGILDGLDGATAVTAIVAAAAILAVVGFAKWGAKKVAKFFG